MGVYCDRVEDILREWGRWSKVDTVSLGHKPGILGRIHGSTVRSPMISDYEAQVVDGAVSRLAEADPELHQVVVLSFARGYTTKMLSRSLRRSETVLKGQRKSAVYFIGSALPTYLTKDPSL